MADEFSSCHNKPFSPVFFHVNRTETLDIGVFRFCRFDCCKAFLLRFHAFSLVALLNISIDDNFKKIGKFTMKCIDSVYYVLRKMLISDKKSGQACLRMANKCMHRWILNHSPVRTPQSIDSSPYGCCLPALTRFGSVPIPADRPSSSGTRPIHAPTNAAQTSPRLKSVCGDSRGLPCR